MIERFCNTFSGGMFGEDDACDYPTRDSQEKKNTPMSTFIAELESPCKLFV